MLAPVLILLVWLLLTFRFFWFFFLSFRHPSSSTLFPYTTLFRSCWRWRPVSRQRRLRIVDDTVTVPGANRLFREDRKSTRLNSSHLGISYAVFCLKKKNTHQVGVGPDLRRGRLPLARRRSVQPRD